MSATNRPVRVATEGWPMARCPRCGATLSPAQAYSLPGPAGYAAALPWPHRRPDSGEKCFATSGLPLDREEPAAEPEQET